MQSDNETVAEVAKAFGDNIALMRKCKCVGVSLWNCLKFKLRFEAAHKLEIAAKDAEIAELRRCLQEAADYYFKNQCPRCAGCRSTLRCEYKEWKAVLEKYMKSEGGKDAH